MPLKFQYVLLLSLLCCALTPRAQDREIGLSVGGMYYLGELNQKHFSNLKPAVGLSLRHIYQKRLAWEQHLILGTINGADSLQDDPILKNRNLSFRNSIIELGTQLEIYYFECERGNKQHFATPYLFFGFSAFYSNPETLYNGEWYKLRDIGTEGQLLGGGKKYNLINFAIPLGAGFKVFVGKSVSINIFSGFRKTFSDQVDDVGGSYADVARFNQQDRIFVDRSLVKGRPNGTNTGLDRGNTNTKDWYNYTGLSICFKFGRLKKDCEAYN